MTRNILVLYSETHKTSFVSKLQIGPNRLYIIKLHVCINAIGLLKYAIPQRI